MSVSLGEVFAALVGAWRVEEERRQKAEAAAQEERRLLGLRWRLAHPRLVFTDQGHGINGNLVFCHQYRSDGVQFWVSSHRWLDEAGLREHEHKGTAEFVINKVHDRACRLQALADATALPHDLVRIVDLAADCFQPTLHDRYCGGN